MGLEVEYMKTNVIGFPRVGLYRELKFSTEKYFKKEISYEKLEECAHKLKVSNWKIMKESGIDFIPSNDFSFYDTTLDTAMAFNIIPNRYKDLGLNFIDTYFAQARGYQGPNGDVRALAMKKWFNTNYHYLVPELYDDTKIELVSSKIIDEYLEAKEEGYETKPVILGPYSLLTLSRVCGSKTKDSYVSDLVLGYKELFKRLNEIGTSWLQLDEPCIVLDLDNESKKLFKDIYSVLLEEKNGLKILIQTYFGDVRDNYKDLLSLPFDGIGLDFIEGKKNLDLIINNGFDNSKVLFAGVINGKNIWKNNYNKTIELINKLKTVSSNIVLSTSCSLLHVPYRVSSEIILDQKYKKHLSFAYEKLKELLDIKNLISIDYKNDERYLENQKLFNIDGRTNSAVWDRISNIKESDYIRHPGFYEREKIQREVFKLPLFPTTTIGSFPQTNDVKQERKKLRVADISEDEYNSFVKKKIKECIELQERLGFDVLVHGEYERNDMVEYFGINLDGFIFTEYAWVQSYGTRCVKPPLVWGDIKRRNPISVMWSSYAKSLTKKPVKGMLTGPVTILNWSFPREDISIKDQITQIALAIRDEVLDLEDNGINIIQIDEAALREKLPLRKEDWNKEYLDFAIPAFRLVHSGVKPETQIHTHMCYSEFNDIIKSIDDMDADVITFEASRSDLQVLKALKENDFKTEVGPGVYDIHSPRVPSVLEIVSSVKKMIEYIDPKKLWINPDCGLKTRGVEETVLSLTNLTSAAKELRKLYDCDDNR